MYSIVISVALAAVVTLGLHYPLGVNWPISVAAGVAVAIASFAGMAWYFNKRLEARMPEVEGALGARQVDVAIRILEDMRSLAKWQPTVGMAVDGQIGSILYAHKQDAEAARPYLEKAIPQNWYAKAMLGAYHFRKRDAEAMRKVFEAAVKRNKKQAMLWSAYAWCLWKLNQTDEAIAVLERAKKHVGDDEGVERNLTALRAGRKMRMSAYEPEWWALLLERPPARVLQGGRRGGGRHARRM